MDKRAHNSDACLIADGADGPADTPLADSPTESTGNRPLPSVALHCRGAAQSILPRFKYRSAGELVRRRCEKRQTGGPSEMSAPAAAI